MMNGDANATLPVIFWKRQNTIFAAVIMKGGSFLSHLISFFRRFVTPKGLFSVRCDGGVT